MEIHLKPKTRAVVGVLLFIAMQVVAGILARIGFHVGFRMSVALSYSLVFTGIVTIVALLNLKIVKPKTFDPTTVRWEKTIWAFASALFCFIAMNLLMEQVNLPNLMRKEVFLLARNQWGVFALVLVGPIVEELVFREGIIKAMYRLNYHRWQAILVSAAVFGIIHFNPIQIPFAFVMGLILATIYAKTRNIVASSIIHIINNAAAVIEIRLLGYDYPTFRYADLIGGNLVAWIIIIISSILCYFCIMRFWHTYHHNGASSSSSRSKEDASKRMREIVRARGL